MKEDKQLIIAMRMVMDMEIQQLPHRDVQCLQVMLLTVQTVMTVMLLSNPEQQKCVME